MCGYINFILLVFLFHNIESKKNLRIVGGRDAEENEYSYVARVEILRVTEDRVGRTHVCSSAIITPVWALTASHCFGIINQLLQMRRHISNSKNSALLLTRNIKPAICLGKLHDDPAKDTCKDILDSILHPSAKCASSSLLSFVCQNDVGLFRTEPITLNQYAKLSAVDAMSLGGHEVDLVGYGITKSDDGKVDTTLKLNRPLQVMTAMIKSCGDVAAMYPALCIARACGQASSLCSGDSGGPVMHPSGVVAVNSKAVVSDCFVTNVMDRTYMVGQLTPISSYLDWISDVISNKTSGT